MKVSVFGSGNGAYALSFHLVQLGHEVLIYTRESSKKNVAPIIDTGYIEALEAFNKIQAALHGTSKISFVTTDIKKATEFSSVIMLIVPADGQKETFAAALPYLNEYHIWINIPGNFAFVEYLKFVGETSGLEVTKDIPFTLVETSTIPYACRKVQGNQVFINGVKAAMHIGVYPSSRTKTTIEKIKDLFSVNLNISKNVFAANFCNLNFVIHPPITTFNAGWIETTQGDFLFHREGGSNGVLSLMSALDQERIYMAKAMNLEVDDLLTIWKGWYGNNTAKSLRDFLANSPFYNAIKAPSTLNTRYFTEDLSYFLIPLVDYFKKQHQIRSPIAEAIILSATYLTGMEFKNLRNLDDCPKSFNDL